MHCRIIIFKLNSTLIKNLCTFIPYIGGPKLDHKNLEFTLFSIKDANPLVFTVCILLFMNL